MRNKKSIHRNVAVRKAVFRPAYALLVSTLLILPAHLHAQAPVSKAMRVGVARAPGRQSAISSPASNMEYVIDADDVLTVYVVDVPQFSRDYRVAADGTIMIPLLPTPVMAAGLTPNRLSQAIAAKLRTAGLVSHPHVVVSVESSQAHAVAITGAVQKPQIYPIFAPTTLLDVLSQAGGLAPDAGSTAIITCGNAASTESRLTKGARTAPTGGIFKVDLQKLLATGDPRLNVTIYPGDKVTVQRAGLVYVVGAVERPGGFPLSNSRNKMTVLQAIAMSQGTKSTALQKKAMIIRRGGQYPDGRVEIPVNLRKILAGHSADPGLEANDILFVPDSASKRALKRGADAAIQIATGVVIWGRY